MLKYNLCTLQTSFLIYENDNNMQPILVIFKGIKLLLVCILEVHGINETDIQNFYHDNISI